MQTGRGDSTLLRRDIGVTDFKCSRSQRENGCVDHIVVGADGSDSSAQAIRWALGEADLRGCPVTAVLVWDYLSQYHPDGSTTFDPTYDAHRAGTALDSFVAGALGASDAERVDKKLVFDLASRRDDRGIVGGHSRGVVAPRGVGGFRELLLGSVSQRLLHEAACVAIVRRSTIDSMEPNGRVVVGVDDSDHGQAALMWAAQEAAYRGAQLRVVHAFQPSYVDAPLPTPLDAIDTIHRQGRALLDQAILNADIAANIEIESIAATGSPAKAILEACRDADLVVVGRKGRSMLRARLLGSVATQIVITPRYPPCS